jgi:hypothetical protein
LSLPGLSKRVKVNQHIHFLPNIPLFMLSAGVGMPCSRAGTIQGKVGRIQVLAGLAPLSQTVVCNISTLRSHPTFGNGNRQKTYTLVYPDPFQTSLMLVRKAGSFQVLPSGVGSWPYPQTLD